MSCDVLVSFTQEDAAIGEALLSRIEREGWLCRSARTGQMNAGGDSYDYRALVLLISRHGAASPYILRDAERATSRNLPIFPVRLDHAPLPKYLDYFVGSLGVVNAVESGDAAAAARLCEALGKHLPRRGPLKEISSSSAGSERGVPEAAPSFRSRPLLRRWIEVMCVVVLVAAFASLLSEIAALFPRWSASRLRGPLALACGDAWNTASLLMLVWLYNAYRNLICLGASGLRYGRARLFWYLILPPINLVASVRVIREILLKTPGRSRDRREWLFLWSWQAGIVAVLLQTPLIGGIDSGLGTWLTACIVAQNLILLFAIPGMLMLIRNVSRSQLAARSDRFRPEPAPAPSVDVSRVCKLLVSYAAADRHSAEVICEALEARNIDCWIPSSQGSTDVRAVDNFDGLILVVSANLEPDGPTLRELERAVVLGKLVIPFRIDRCTRPQAFQYLLGSIHWTGYQSSRRFEEEIEAVAQVIRRSVRSELQHAPETPQGAEDYKPGKFPIRPARGPSLWRGAFYFIAAVYGVLAVIIACVNGAALATGAESSPAYAVKGLGSIFVGFTAFRAGLLAVYLPLFYASLRGGRTHAAAADRGFWPVALVLSSFGGMGAQWIAGPAGIKAAIVFDLLVSIAGVLALVSGVRRVADVAGPRLVNSNEQLRFDPQLAIQRWIARMSIGCALYAVLMVAAGIAYAAGLDLTDPNLDRERNELLFLFVMHIVIALVPVCLLFLVWLATAYRNLLALGIETRYTPARAVRALVNPLLNVFLAVSVVRDLWKASGGPATRVARFTVLWWSLILLYWASLWVRFFSNRPHPSPWLLIVSDAAAGLLFVTVAVMTNRLVRDINALQMHQRLQRR